MKHTNKFNAISYILTAAMLFPIINGLWFVFVENRMSFLQFLCRDASFRQAFSNSTVVYLGCLAGQLITGISAGWGLARFHFFGKRLLLFFCLLVVTLPLQVLVFPLYQIFQRLGLLDTLWALILPGAFSPLGAILMWHAFSGIPTEQIQSAEELGANEAQILFRLALPLCKRDVLLLCLVTLAEQWNQLEFSMAFLQSKENYTLSVYLATNAVSDTVQLLADCLFSLLPLCIVFAAFLLNSKRRK